MKVLIIVDKHDQKGTIDLFFIYVRIILICRGSSVVEHAPEERSVDGSIPSPGTNLRQDYGWQAILLRSCDVVTLLHFNVLKT